MKKFFITGITGFAGSHLADYILSNKLGEVHGTIRTYNAKLDNIKHILDKVKLFECDLTDQNTVLDSLKQSQPDYVFHLAAQAFVPKSWLAPHETINSNIFGTVNLLEALRRLELNPQIHLAGSSEEYGLVLENEVPIKESNPLRPLSPYGVSKVATDLFGYQYFKSYGLKIVRTRAFNHTGPRRGQVYVASNWCKQIAEIEAKKREPKLFCGNLDARRDFTDVRDIVKAYYLAAEKGVPGEEYNIGTGKAYSMKELQQMLLKLTKIKIEIVKDPSRMRPSDVPLLLCDSTKFIKQTGWKPEIPFEQTLKDLLNYWREKVNAK